MASISRDNAEQSLIFKENKSFCACVRACQKEMTCFCGEPEYEQTWGWDEKHSTPSIKCCNNNQQVYFHKGYSTGNACVRGDIEMTCGNDYYFEVKMISSVYGTSIMIGVGTDKFDLNQANDKYCNLLGCDNESWGMNFVGELVHGNKVQSYHTLAGFTIGSIIGVHLDMWNGTLEYYLNRIPLGIAFTGLKDKKLYPMLSSTAAHSVMKLVYSNAEPFSLHLLSFKSLPTLCNLPPGLERLVKNCWWLLPKSSRIKNETLPMCGPYCEPSHDIYIMVASDEEDDETNRTSLSSALLAQRMRGVIENSESQIHHRFLRFGPGASSPHGDLIQLSGPIRRCRTRARTHWTEY